MVLWTQPRWPAEPRPSLLHYAVFLRSYFELFAVTVDSLKPVSSFNKTLLFKITPVDVTSFCTRTALIRSRRPGPLLRGGAASPGPPRPPAPPAEAEVAAGSDMGCPGCAGLLLLLGLLQLLGRTAACPCQDPRLCQPIAGTDRFEVRVPAASGAVPAGRLAGGSGRSAG